MHPGRPARGTGTSIRLIAERLLIEAITYSLAEVFRGPPIPGDPGGGSGLPFSLGDHGVWTDSGPDPEGSIF